MMMLKFKTTNEVTNWVSSDFHLGHQRPFVWETRGFDSHQHHTDSVIETINEYVSPNDNFFYLGDFSLNTTESQFEDYISRIKCQNIYMIWGNHNNPVEKIYNREVLSQYGKPDIKVYPLRYKNVIFMGDYLEVAIDGRAVVMFHYPIDIWNYMKDGSYMLCGHSHYSYPKTQKVAKSGLILDVGWDGYGRPYEFEEIISIMKSKEIKSVDHHKN